MCAAVWVVVYLLHLPNHIGWGDLRFSDLFFLCTFANHVHSYALFYVLVGVFIPLTVSFICYLQIYLKVKDSKLTRTRILFSAAAGQGENPTSQELLTVNASFSSRRSAANTSDSELDMNSGNCLTISQKFLDDLKVIQVGKEMSCMGSQKDGYWFN